MKLYYLLIIDNNAYIAEDMNNIKEQIVKLARVKIRRIIKNSVNNEN